MQLHQIKIDSHYESYAQLQFILITEVTRLESSRLGTIGFGYLRSTFLDTWYTNSNSELKWSNE